MSWMSERNLIGDSLTSGMTRRQQGSVMGDASRLASQTQWARIRAKKGVLVVACIVLVLIIGVIAVNVVSAGNSYVITPDQMAFAVGYRYPDLSWGMSPEEAAVALPVAMGNKQTEGNLTVYTVEKGATLGEERSKMKLTFEDRRLMRVEMTFEPEDAAGWCQTQITAFAEHCGTPETTADGAVWSDGGTTLQLTHADGTVTLTVGR